MERRLSDVICENTDIKSLQKNAFLTKGPDNPLVPCRDTNLRSRLDFLGLAKSLAVLLGAEFTPSAVPEENVSDLENRYGVWKMVSLQVLPERQRSRRPNVLPFI